ncbi:MAG: glutathione S-transferase family protein [Betaproteobacteria bacterium]|nr:glutathione S-transferase family protein [Betaproteobacteria bacterium]
MRITLYYVPSNASMAPHLLLNEIGCPFELKLVDRENNEHQSAEYLKLNPSGLIPVLVDEGRPIHQTAAILLHLTDKFPSAGFAPGVGDARRPALYQWLFYLSNTLQPELITYFYPHRLADDEAMAERVKHHAEQRVAGMLDLLEAHLAAQGPFMLGADFSITDLMLLMLCRWTRMHARPAQTRPHLKRLIETVAARPAVVKTFAVEKLPLPWY